MRNRQIALGRNLKFEEVKNLGFGVLANKKAAGLATFLKRTRQEGDF